MQLSAVKEIIDCLPQGKTRFHYFKDRYALLLLSMAVAGSTTKPVVRRSAYARLLGKDVVKQALSRRGRTSISADDFHAWWPNRYQSYVLTLDHWGSNDRYWDQVTRPGCNLVLQLNFSKEHDRAFETAVDQGFRGIMESSYHPIAKARRKTLAWARIDIDLQSGDALIEELQSD